MKLNSLCKVQWGLNIPIHLSSESKIQKLVHSIRRYVAPVDIWLCGNVHYNQNIFTVFIFFNFTIFEQNYVLNFFFGKVQIIKFPPEFELMTSRFVVNTQSLTRCATLWDITVLEKKKFIVYFVRKNVTILRRPKLP